MTTPLTSPERATAAATAAAALLPAAEPLAAAAPEAGTPATPHRLRRCRRLRARPARPAPSRRSWSARTWSRRWPAARWAGSTWQPPPSRRWTPPPARSAPRPSRPAWSSWSWSRATSADPFTVVPLVGATGPAGALLLPDTLLVAGPEAPVADAAFAALPGMAGGTPAASTPATVVSRGIEMLHGVDMEVTVELGRTQMTVRDLLALSPGTVLELDRAAGSPADLLVNGRLIARGEVVVVDEDFGLRVTEIIDESVAS